MKKTGVAVLPLHSGHVPRWLFDGMVKLSSALVAVIVEDFGPREFLRRVSNPYWFQAFGCAIGFDWHSSGLTTVVTGVLREALDPELHGVAMAGGKGRVSRRVPEQLEVLADKLGIPSTRCEELKRASRLSAKVDNAAVQDGYTIYHHAIFIAEGGDWAVVQQGMNPLDRLARRYHWLGERVASFVNEPHAGIAAAKVYDRVLDMTARESEEARKVSVDLVRERPGRLARLIGEATRKQEATLYAWMPGAPEPLPRVDMTVRVNWAVLKKLYELQPSDYEHMLEVRGVGPKLVRALALVGHLVYGAEPSWKDPAKFSFTVGGKDGVPFPVDRRTMEELIQYLSEAVERAKLGDKEKMRALARIKRLLP